jgi:outer membrane protein OmpA-like peptidoglycan-associated protein
MLGKGRFAFFQWTGSASSAASTTARAVCLRVIMAQPRRRPITSAAIFQPPACHKLTIRHRTVLVAAADSPKEHPMIRPLFAFCACLTLAACADDVMDHDNGHWLVTHHTGETDYEMAGLVLFPSDSADLSPRAESIIASVAEDARRNRKGRIEVEGFTDTSGNHDYNMKLSQARAEKVADVLVHHGVPVERIVARGYGETRLAVKTGNGVKEPRNRRVVIRMLDT